MGARRHVRCEAYEPRGGQLATRLMRSQSTDGSDMACDVHNDND